MVEIPVGKSRVALVDDEDAYLAVVKWSATGERGLLYAVSRGSTGERVAMHRLILDVPPGMQVDHINGDGLDNRRSNLRVVTCRQNQWNRGPKKRNALGLKGVGRAKRSNRFYAQIGIDGRTRYLGVYDTPELAALAYDCVALAYYGQFARLNIAGNQAATVAPRTVAEAVP